jgi:hypothetical protein
MAEEFDPFMADTAQFPTVSPPRRDRGGLVVVAVVLGALGLIVGVAGVAVAAVALGRSDRAVSLAGSARPGAPAGPPPSGAAPGPPDVASGRQTLRRRRGQVRCRASRTAWSRT